MLLHAARHREPKKACDICGKLVQKDWMIHHVQIQHGDGEKKEECKECGKIVKKILFR